MPTPRMSARERVSRVRLSAGGSRAPALERWTTLQRRLVRALTDRRNRRHLALVALSVVVIAAVAAANRVIGFYLGSRKEISLEVGIAAVATVAVVFALCQRRIEALLEAKFSRTIVKHRQALAALTEELAVLDDTRVLAQRLVESFDALLDTEGASLYLATGNATFLRLAATGGAAPASIGEHDPAVLQLRLAHDAIAPAEVGSALDSPLAWPLRVRGRLIGILASGQRDHVETFDALEVEAVATLADSVAATLALLDPALVALPRQQVRHNLPSPPQSFVGRARELDLCRALLVDGRLLTLIGFGGTGKTRFALHLAHQVIEAYPGGVWWVPLATVADPGQIPSIVARTLGVAETPGAARVDCIAQHVASRATLLILDDCEHLLPGCVVFVTELLQAAPQLSILATSQQPLHVEVERRHALPTLAIAEPGATDLESCDAVALFVARARAGAPDFAPDRAAIEIIADICRRLDGIALAIELAAARVRLLGLEEIRDRLDDRFRLLATASTASVRGQTLRASIAWTLDHLPPIERSFLRRLAVFTGGFTLQAATRVAHNGNDDFVVLEILDGLVEKSLIRVERDRSHATRYTMPHTLRQFARESAGDADDGLGEERHLDFFLELAEQAAVALRGGAAASWLAVLDGEFGNLQQAHVACLHGAGRAERGLRLARALERYWLERGLLVAGQHHAEEALSHPEASAPTALRATVLHSGGALAIAAGDGDAARRMLEEAEAIARALPAPAILRATLGARGCLAQRDGDLPRSREFFEEALAIARNGLPPTEIAEALEDLSEHLHDTGDLDGAMRAGEEALALLRPTGDVPDLHVAVRDLARLAVERGDLDRAATLLEEALGLALRTAARFDGEHDLEVAAALAAARTDWAVSAQFAGAADAAAAAMGSVRSPHDRSSIAALASTARLYMAPGAHAAAHAAGGAMPFADALVAARAWVAALVPAHVAAERNDAEAA